jgi:hypothetical protein
VAYLNFHCSLPVPVGNAVRTAVLPLISVSLHLQMSLLEAAAIICLLLAVSIRGIEGQTKQTRDTLSSV